MKENTIEQKKSVKEGGLEASIEKMRSKIYTLNDMVDQIERLQRVPAGYKNLAGDGKVDPREQPALDQWANKRIEYNGRIERVNESLEKTYMEVMNVLDLLRGITGISNKEEAMKFDINTGRQEKDK